MSRTVAALYVAPGGCYYGLPDVIPYGLPERDAREYAGPWPVVAHPPCARWGRYWSGGPSAKVRRQKGDDGGCFAAALASVRTWGGVLEHPEASHAWRAFGLLAPPRGGGWVPAGDWIGWTCCVEQGHYGHRARKATWLYAAHVELPELLWGSSGTRTRLDRGFHSSDERKMYRRESATNSALRLRSDWDLHRITDKERLATPIPFRDLLLSIARTARQHARTA